MRRETITGKWEREPIFVSSHGSNSYFCHVFHDGQQVGTVRAERIGNNDWDTMVEDTNGEIIHSRNSSYPFQSPSEAVLDMVDWFVGQ